MVLRFLSTKSMRRNIPYLCIHWVIGFIVMKKGTDWKTGTRNWMGQRVQISIYFAGCSLRMKGMFISGSNLQRHRILKEDRAWLLRHNHTIAISWRISLYREIWSSECFRTEMYVRKVLEPVSLTQIQFSEGSLWISHQIIDRKSWSTFFRRASRAISFQVSDFPDTSTRSQTQWLRRIYAADSKYLKCGQRWLTNDTQLPRSFTWFQTLGGFLFRIFLLTSGYFFPNPCQKRSFSHMIFFLECLRFATLSTAKDGEKCYHRWGVCAGSQTRGGFLDCVICGLTEQGLNLQTNQWGLFDCKIVDRLGICSSSCVKPCYCRIQL